MEKSTFLPMELDGISMSSGIEELYAPQIMCQLCFGAFDREQLWVDHSGGYWDVCKQCKADEYSLVLARVKSIIERANFFNGGVETGDIVEAFGSLWEEI
jgi:hypothetical protein